MLLEVANHVRRNSNLGCGMQIRDGFHFSLQARGLEVRPHLLTLFVRVNSCILEERNSLKRRTLSQEVKQVYLSYFAILSLFD